MFTSFRGAKIAAVAGLLFTANATASLAQSFDELSFREATQVCNNLHYAKVHDAKAELLDPNDSRGLALRQRAKFWRETAVDAARSIDEINASIALAGDEKAKEALIDRARKRVDPARCWWYPAPAADVFEPSFFGGATFMHVACTQLEKSANTNAILAGITKDEGRLQQQKPDNFVWEGSRFPEDNQFRLLNIEEKIILGRNLPSDQSRLEAIRSERDVMSNKIAARVKETCAKPALIRNFNRLLEIVF
ncbi:MAG: hypothetical protein QOJ96_719 [Alphaproteobacteria bacterium]|jgi:hypothetical protein|nr:hypothetical protein [Alphaproteobacteria bacterium]